VSAAGWSALLLAAGLLALLHRRSVLAARAGHEIRGPLCAALLGLERLGVDPHALAAVELELRRAALAADELAGGRRGGVLEPVDLGSLLRTAAPGWAALASAHGARLALDVDARGGLLVLGDRVRLAQACGNLVANAVEHGGGAVVVRARALGAAVRVEVTDAGPGLSRPVGAIVARASVRRGRRGHGLAVAARVAERHGGRLAAGPSPCGARLVLELPAAS
jgi:signal transduction histidine kinase